MILFPNRKNSYVIIFFISLISIIFALYIEYVLKYQPCKLCIYQRLPYIAAIFVTLIGFNYSNNDKILIVTIMIFTLSAILSGYHFGIENNIIDWDFTLDDPGYFILPEDGRIYRGWKKGGHGNINLNDAIIESSNTFFFSLAYKSEIEDLTKHLSNFGFGEIVCLDCFLPDSGLLPNPSWKMNNLNFGWFKGDTVNLGVGQGYMSATPIQLAYYASFLANKGELNKFSFVQERLSGII